MKLLVLAQIPPPLHGQSVMVQTLVSGLPGHGIPVRHVNLALSRDATDIGRIRPGKVLALLAACGRTVAARFQHGCDTLYYVPAPGKRGALWRDLVTMLICRPFFRRLVLHWHAAGLAEWLRDSATLIEQRLALILLGRPTLSLVLGDALRADAFFFDSKSIKVVRNGIPDPCVGFNPQLRPPPHTALFLGLCCESKGLFDAIGAVAGANAVSPDWRLIVAGDFSENSTRQEFEALRNRHQPWLSHVGFVSGESKSNLLARADALLFPTRYPAETQGLVVLEALAHAMPVIVTRWRAVHEQLPEKDVHIVAPANVEEMTAALHRVAQRTKPSIHLREYFLRESTADQFLAKIASALRGLE